MNSSQGLLRLFTKLASDLRRSNASTVEAADEDDDGGEMAGLVSSLTRSLNSDDRIEPRIRVLDAALSLMCFKTPEVCSARIECLVGTIVSVLSSSVSCKVWRLGGEGVELLQVGSLMLPGDLDEMIQACTDVLGSLNGHNGLSYTLLYAVLKAAISSSSYQVLFPLLSTLYEENEKSSADRKTAISKLMYFLPEDISINSHEIPLRLLSWYLDPLILKHDVSEILRETIQRPFLCLNEELHDRMAWRSIIICLVTSPTIFLETRALLHHWFLLTGSTSVLDLGTAIVSAVLDVLSRPMWWGVPMELGLKYPFSHAYFPIKHRELLAILSGPISSESFMDLVSQVGMAISPTTKHPNTSHPSQCIRANDASVDAVDTKSCWAMVLQFPNWFYFATSLIFCGNRSQDSHLFKLIFGADDTSDTVLHQAAIRFISWVLRPTDEAHRYLLADHLQGTSTSWTTKYTATCGFEQKSNSDTNRRNTVSRGKKLRIPKASDCERLHLASEDDSGSAIGVWLKEFDVVCRTAISHVPAEAEAKQDANMQVKIPLGILISCPSYLDERGCQLLLHYAATGDVIQLEEMERKSEGRFGHDGLSSSRYDDGKWALNGAYLVFSLSDIIEDMSVALFDNEDTRHDYICQLKGKASRYLLRCLKTLLRSQSLQLQIDEAGGTVATNDLCSRLRKWMQQGRGVFEGYKVFDDVVDELVRRF